MITIACIKQCLSVTECYNLSEYTYVNNRHLDQCYTLIIKFKHIIRRILRVLIMATFGKKDVFVLGKQELYKGFFKCERYEFTHALFAGGQSTTVKREVFDRGHAVAVLPYDPNTNELVLLEQFRFPAMQASESPWLIEVVAGIIEEGETKEDVCIREAKEEAGIEIFDLLPVSTFLPSPGACTEMIYLYIAQVDSTTAKGIHGLDCEAEDIKVLRVSLDTAQDWLESGKLNNATTIIALQHLLLNKSRILQAWGKA